MQFQPTYIQSRLRCPECGARLAFTGVSLVCPNCGLVVEPRPAYTGPREWSGIPPPSPPARGVATGPRGGKGENNAYHKAVSLAVLFGHPSPGEVGRLAARLYRDARRRGLYVTSAEAAVAAALSALRRARAPVPLKTFVRRAAERLGVPERRVRRAAVRLAHVLGVRERPPSHREAVNILAEALGLPARLRLAALEAVDVSEAMDPWMAAASAVAAHCPPCGRRAAQLLGVRFKTVSALAGRLRRHLGLLGV